jgi:membrane protein implicated in regulation of membrane protease activity
MSTQLSRQAILNLSRILPPGCSADPFERKAIVTQTIYPNIGGSVKFLGTWWTAFCEQDTALNEGSSVYVVNLINLTLIVEPAS